MSSNGWKEMNLEEAGIILFDCEHKTPKAQSNGYPYIAIPQLKNGNIDLSDSRLINYEDLLIWTKKIKPKEDDVVLSRRCNPGETAFIPKGLTCAIGQNLVILRSNGEQVFPPFLRYIVKGPEWWTQIEKYLNTGAVFDSLKCADIPKFKLFFPPISEQKKIYKILSSLDEKIELNRQTNAILEAIAQAIFKEWFIDFNFPGATGGMIESELGLIPKGWRVGRLGEIVELRNERVQASLETMNLPYVPIDLISPKSLFLQNFHNGDQAKTSLIKFYKEDIIFGAMRPYFHKVCIAPFDGTTRTTAFVLCPKNEIDYSFMTLILHDPKTIEFASQNSTGSTIPYAKWNGSMANMLIIIPPEKIRSNFNEIIKSLFDSIHPKIFENNTLTTIRDSLLPKLMNGEVEINY